MNIIIDRQQFDCLWSALKAAPKVSKQTKAKLYFEKIVKQGWASTYDVTEVVYMLDSRLDDHNLDVYDLSKLLGAKWETVFRRPSTRSNGTTGEESIRATDLAALLILLEQIGFECAPKNLIELLLPDITVTGKSWFTDSELEIFWYQKVRHKKQPIKFLLKEPDDSWFDSRVIQKVNTKSGYKISLRGTEVDQILGLVVSAPKYRRPTSTTPIECPDCGLTWSKGDPDWSYYHRKEHKKRIIYMDPKPNSQFLLARQEESDPELVTLTSPAWKHKEMYSRAVAFKQEFHFDFVQWHSPKGITDKDTRGFLFGDDAGAIVGACSFRNSNINESGKRWILDWIWICPKQRRVGHLAKRWEEFKSRFGDFYVSPPVSDAMKSFLAKQGDLRLLDNFI